MPTSYINQIVKVTHIYGDINHRLTIIVHKISILDSDERRRMYPRTDQNEDVKKQNEK